MLALSLVNPVSLRTSEITIFQAEVTIYLYTKGANSTFILSFLPPLCFGVLFLIWGICHTFLKARVTHVGLGRLQVTTSSLCDPCKPTSTPHPISFLLALQIPSCLPLLRYRRNVLHQHTVSSNTWSLPSFHVVISGKHPSGARGEEEVIFHLWKSE